MLQATLTVEVLANASVSLEICVYTLNELVLERIQELHGEQLHKDDWSDSVDVDRGTMAGQLLENASAPDDARVDTRSYSGEAVRSSFSKARRDACVTPACVTSRFFALLCHVTLHSTLTAPFDLSIGN